MRIKIFSNFHGFRSNWPFIFFPLGINWRICSTKMREWANQRKRQRPEKRGGHCKGNDEEDGLLWRRRVEKLDWHLQVGFFEVLDHLETFLLSLFEFGGKINNRHITDQAKKNSKVLHREKNHLKHQCNCMCTWQQTVPM